MFLLIDNYDSFTNNLMQAFKMLGEKPLMLKNDDPKILELAASNTLKKVCISSGGGKPQDAGLCFEFLGTLAAKNNKVPVLGVGLGHLIISAFVGAALYFPARSTQGKSAMVEHSAQGIFKGITQPMSVGRYDAMLVSSSNLQELNSIATCSNGDVMAVQHKQLPWIGVQFQPDSVLTPEGLNIFENFLSAFSDQGKKQDANHLSLLKNETPLPISNILEALGSRKDLNIDMAKQVFARLMDGELSLAQAGGVLLALRSKGETPLEMAMAAEAVLARAIQVPLKSNDCIDVVGTGGDGRSSFNCSTGTALVLAGMGFSVVKHGNRSVSSKCGSADVLERLGFSLSVPPSEVQALLDKKKFVFLFAPQYHPAFKHVMPVRKELGIRTLFNLLGPLVNPVQPKYRLIGVPTAEILPLMSGTLAYFGGSNSALVYGAGGYDELTPIGASQVHLVIDKTVKELVINPKDYGIDTCTPEDLSISGPMQGEQVLRLLLAGKGSKAMSDMLALNVGLGLFILKAASLSGATNGDFNKVEASVIASSLAECMQQAKDAVAQGVAQKVLNA